MAVAMMVDNPHGSQDIYERVRELIGLERPAGGILHLAGPGPDGGWRVIEVWGSEHDARRFFEERVLPAAEAVGTPAPAAPGLACTHLHASGREERAMSTNGHHARNRLLAGTPVSERRVSLAGVSTAVLEGGDGPPLVLLHGGIECGGAYWAPVASRLVKNNRVVIPDVPGLGESEPVERLDADAFAEWFTELVRATCQERPTVIAHSLLGTLAARFAATDGEVLRRLVVYSAPGVGPYRMPLGLRVTAIRFAVRPSERNAERFDRWAFADFDRAREQDAGWFEAFSEYTRSRAVVPHVKRTMRQLIGSCTKQVPDAELGSIQLATDLLWGRHDRFVPLSLAEATSPRLNWPLHVIEDAGHVPHIEQPDAFLGALQGALDANNERGQR